MANKKNMVTIKDFQEAINKTYTHVNKIEWNGVEVEIKNTLSFEEMASFIGSVVSNCINNKTGEYISGVFDYAFKSSLFEYYTNITLPKDIEKRYELMYHSGFANIILENIDREQISAITKAIKEKIKITTDVNKAEFVRQQKEFYDSLNALKERLEGLLGSITPEDIKGIVNAVSNGSIDEEKLVKAYIENTKTE